MSRTQADLSQRLQQLETERATRENDRLLLLDRLARLEDDAETYRSAIDALRAQLLTLESRMDATKLDARRIDACATRERLEAVAAELSERVAALSRRAVTTTDVAVDARTPRQCQGGVVVTGDGGAAQ